MFEQNDNDIRFRIDKVIQKAKINVNEYGTEAAAVTGALMVGDGPGTPKVVDFCADHPFVYLISEDSSGIILFAGVFNGK